MERHRMGNNGEKKEFGKVVEEKKGKEIVEHKNKNGNKFF